MARRPAITTQADITRVIRALDACGKRFGRVLIRKDGIVIETDTGDAIAVSAMPVDEAVNSAEIIL